MRKVAFASALVAAMATTGVASPAFAQDQKPKPSMDQVQAYLKRTLLNQGNVSGAVVTEYAWKDDGCKLAIVQADGQGKRWRETVTIDMRRVNRVQQTTLNGGIETYREFYATRPGSRPRQPQRNTPGAYRVPAGSERDFIAMGLTRIHEICNEGAANPFR